MKLNLFSLAALCLLFACNAGKNAKGLDFTELSIGKSQTGLIGEVVSFSEDDNAITIILKVNQSKQGGATSPVIAPNKEISGSIAAMTRRKIEQDRSYKISEDLSRGKLIAITVKKRDTSYEILDIHYNR